MQCKERNEKISEDQEEMLEIKNTVVKNKNVFGDLINTGHGQRENP